MGNKLPINSEIIIRNATIDDVDAITEIYNEALLEGIASFDEPPISKTRYQAYFKEDRERSCLLVAELNKKIIGWTSIDPISDRFAYRFTCVGSTYVKKEFTGNKIGTRLKQNQFNAAKKLGYHSIVGEILKVNLKSLAFLLKFDYEIVGELKEAGHRNNKWIGLVIIQKFL